MLTYPLRSLLLLLLFLSSCSSHRSPQRTAPVEFRQAVPMELYRPIVLDPGHGGSDTGARSKTTPPIYEKIAALETARLVQAALVRMGYKVRMTRSKDIFVPLMRRVEMANSMKARLFVSIHYNSAPNPNVHGVEIFFYKSHKNTARSLASKKLGESILFQLKKAVHPKIRGVKAGNFCVIRETAMPAVLVEAAFLSNPQEAKLVASGTYRAKLAKAIAAGIDEFIRSTP